ncbi:Hydrolase [Paraburkholderia kururiensis]|uniref:HAD domain-containing protein n=1 Tax=Paraburkholderia kururiensis TaxID=984307 RepID=UPI0039A5C87D
MTHFEGHFFAMSVQNVAPTLESARSVLLLDYDGVLHRGDAFRTKMGIVSSDPSRIQLFEFAELLAGILDPYPDVEIVLSTSWVKALGFTRARDALPVKALRDKVVGATYHTRFHDAHQWHDLLRGAQVLRYVQRHHLGKWLAIDDHAEGFEMVPSNLVLCDTDKALGDAGVQTVLKAALHNTFGCGPPSSGRRI